MHTKSFLGLLTIGLVFCACKKDLEPQESSVPLTPAAQAAPNTSVPGQPVANVAPTPANMTAVPAQPGQPAQVAPGMNPPHGQPNHRCDIAVGAPLSSPPVKTADPKPAMTISSADIIKQQLTKSASGGSTTPALLNPSPAVAATAPGMNPPHGQAGHRCDIAVGAPLDSPAKAAETKTDATPKLDITVSDPAKAEPKKAE